MNQRYGLSGCTSRCSGGYGRTPCRIRSRQGLDRGIYPFGCLGVPATPTQSGCGGQSMPHSCKDGQAYTHTAAQAYGCASTKPVQKPCRCTSVRSVQAPCGGRQSRSVQNTCVNEASKPLAAACGCTSNANLLHTHEATAGHAHGTHTHQNPPPPLHSVSTCPEASALMDRIRAVDFALYETILYLDVYPDSCQALDTYHRLRADREALHGEFESRFGPLTAFGNESTTSWDWMSRPAPWEYGAE